MLQNFKSRIPMDPKVQLECYGIGKLFSTNTINLYIKFIHSKLWALQHPQSSFYAVGCRSLSFDLFIALFADFLFRVGVI